MDIPLKQRIAEIRNALAESDDPSIGLLSAGTTQNHMPSEIPAIYKDFLREVDGAVCGMVTLYEHDELLGQQELMKKLPGGRHHWFCFGEIESKALILDTRLNTVHVFDPEEKFDPDESLGEFDYALLTYVFGEGYAELVLNPADDGWYQLLESLQLNA